MLSHLGGGQRVKECRAVVTYGTQKSGDVLLREPDFSAHFNVWAPALVGDGVDVGCVNVMQIYRLCVDIDIPLEYRRCAQHSSVDVYDCVDCASLIMAVGLTAKDSIEALIRGFHDAMLVKLFLALAHGSFRLTVCMMRFV